MDKQKDTIVEQLHKTIKKSPVGLTELIYFGGNEATTRFANNRIHQNVSENSSFIRCRIIEDGKTGTASANQFDDDTINAMFQQATLILKSVPPAKIHPQLPGPQQYKEMNCFDEQTNSISPRERAEIVRKIIAEVEKAGLSAAGTIVNGSGMTCMTNSKGNDAFHHTSLFQMTLTVYGENGQSGWAAVEGCRFDENAIFEAVRKTIERTLASKRPVPVHPGKFTVILEPPAVATFLEFLGYFAFSAKAYLHQNSCFTDNLGNQITGKEVTIVDDPFHPKTLGMPFDFEGTPKKTLTLIDEGIAKNLVHDSLTATQMNTVTTGHSMVQPNTSGPYPGNLVLLPGTQTRQELIESTEFGILVTRFHYTRSVDQKKTLLTGLTRDGTFFIRDGKIAFPINNMRYNESIIGSFSRIEGISDESVLHGEYGKVVAPALKIRDFNFTDISLEEKN